MSRRFPCAPLRIVTRISSKRGSAHCAPEWVASSWRRRWSERRHHTQRSHPHAPTWKHGSSRPATRWRRAWPGRPRRPPTSAWRGGGTGSGWSCAPHGPTGPTGTTGPIGGTWGQAGATSRSRLAARAMSERLGPLGLLVLQPTPFCNLDCTYCYLPDRSNRKRMRPEVLERTFARVAESDLVSRPYTVVWHAGEPMV